MAPVDFAASVLQKLPQLILLPAGCLPKPEPNWLWTGSECSGSDQKIPVPAYRYTARCSGHSGIADMSITEAYKTHEGPGRRA